MIAVNMTAQEETMQYDAEGYELATGIHKRLGLRRYFRPRIDSPITAQEAALQRRIEEQEIERDAMIRVCYQRLPATAENPQGGHRTQMISHEESRCIDCGAFFSIPDL